MNVSLWSNVQVAMQSALAAADTIAGITKANPGVVTATAHGLSNGDVVKLAVQGMHQLDSRLFRIANVAADTFELEGEDTTLYDTFSSGSAEGVTFGTTISTLTGLSASGGDFDFIDTTTIHDAVKKQVPGAANPITYSFDSIWDVADAGLVALKAASDNKALRAQRFTFANGQILYFNGYVGAAALPTGNAQDKVVTPVVITMFGRPTVYAS
jgi:hypothetical protein